MKSPCAVCDRGYYCGSMCGLWEAWFRNSWRNLQAFYAVELRKYADTHAHEDTHTQEETENEQKQ